MPRNIAGVPVQPGRVEPQRRVQPRLNDHHVGPGLDTPAAFDARGLVPERTSALADPDRRSS